MSGPGSPGQEGPTFAPPQLPWGWIAQWDANSKKYYFVQLSTGVSQWEVPTDAAPIGGTPASAVEHPYGVPGQPQLITHPDGTQTVKHPDGTMEPVMPDEAGNARGIAGDGPTGDRGLGSMAMNALLGGKQSGNNHKPSSSPFGGLASQVISGLTHQSGGGHQQQQQQHGSSSSGGLGGKLVGQIASGLFSSGSKPAQQQQQQGQGYHSGQGAQSHGSGGLMGGVAHMFGGQSSSSQNQNFGYSNQGHQGGYNGPAPPTTYQPGVHSQHQTPAQHQTPPAHGYQSQPQQHASYSQPPAQYGHSPSHQSPAHPYGQSPSHQTPAHQYGQSPSHFGQQGYGHQQPPQQQQQHQQQTPAYGGFNPSYMPPPPPGQYPSQPSYQAQGPHVPHGSHPYGSNPAY
ncbi:hypothetical protein VSDG_03264 [Cytospora chrysosperma]|uniref:WW domain-containing protein n=1 Tax=Cytospora chrysosperma TaxID=252740 RepID=A0A423WB75_CYTCH|nr:hypothetical protein VSDG_03264 [Valsa sordida]